MTDKSNRAEGMAALIKKFDRLGLSATQRTLVMYGFTYQDGERPLEIWKAIVLCHVEKMRYPKWVTDKLALIAFRMLTDKPGVDARQRVFDATGIEGREFGDERRAAEDIDFCVEIEKKAREKYGIRTKGLSRAREEVADQRGKAHSTIADRHKKIKSNPDYEEMIKNFLRE